MGSAEDIAKLKSACYSRLEYGKSRGGEQKVWLSANRVLDSLYALEKQRDELYAALAELVDSANHSGCGPSASEIDDAMAALAKARGEK